MRSPLASLLAVSLVGAASCSNPDMERRLADLESEVERMSEDLDAAEATIEELKKGGAKPPPKTPAAPETPATAEEETAAGELYTRATEQVVQLDAKGALETLTDMCRRYPSTKSCKRSEKLHDELIVFGRDAGEMDVEKWFTSPGKMDEGKATLLIFWEVWCPHCKREVPALVKTWEAYHADGLNVVGLTKITKSATEEAVRTFIEENKLPYPIGKETGAMSARFNVSGIPAAAVVVDGKVAWRGHPARLTDEMLREWLGLPPLPPGEAPTAPE